MSYLYQRYMKEDSDNTRNLFDLMTMLLEFDPDERLTLATALDHAFFKVPITFQVFCSNVRLHMKTLLESSKRLAAPQVATEKHD